MIKGTPTTVSVTFDRREPKYKILLSVPSFAMANTLTQIQAAPKSLMKEYYSKNRGWDENEPPDFLKLVWQ